MSEEATPEPAKVPEFTYYKPHPLLEFFPPPNEDDLGAMQADVRKVGVQSDIVIWRDAKSRPHLIDGRTRQEASAREYARKIEAGESPVAENGISLQPSVFEFEGTQEEAFRFMERTHIRKHYSPGQKAAMGVRLHYREWKAENGGRLPPVEKEQEDEKFTSPEELGKRFGCNHYYIRICRRLYRNAMDLLDAVAMGVIPPGKAEAQYKVRAAAGAPGSAEEETDDEPKAAKDPAKVKDGHGQEVPEKLADKFRARAAYRVAKNHLEDASRAMETLAASGVGTDWFDQAMFARAIRAANAVLDKSAPHEVCTMCEGHGFKQRHKDRPCPRCGTHGYVCKAILAAEKKGGTADGDTDKKADSAE